MQQDTAGTANRSNMTATFSNQKYVQSNPIQDAIGCLRQQQSLSPAGCKVGLQAPPCLNGPNSPLLVGMQQLVPLLQVCPCTLGTETCRFVLFGCKTWYLQVGSAHLRGTCASKDLTSHHARDGDDPHDTHLVQHRGESQHQAALHRLTCCFHAIGSEG